MKLTTLNKPIEHYPILYSLRNCPYAMRARIAIFKSKQPVLLRDLVLSDKPQAMLDASPKATVPVVVIPKQGNVQEQVIDESLDVMLWALKRSDPNNLLLSENDHALSQMLSLIELFDREFKTVLEQYKCAKRYKEDNLTETRAACLIYIAQLEARLSHHQFLMSKQESLADIALLPFIRQFARVERQWYLQSPYPNLQAWLTRYLQSPMFTKVMAKYPPWLNQHEEFLLGGKKG